MHPDEQASLIKIAAQLDKMRQAAVIVALALLLISLALPNRALAYARFAAWATAAVLTVMRGSKLKALGLPPNYMSAMIYALVAVLPLMRGR